MKYVINTNLRICSSCSGVLDHCYDCTNNITCIKCDFGYYPGPSPVYNATICLTCHGTFINCRNCTSLAC